jgi:hypothetical protein
MDQTTITSDVGLLAGVLGAWAGALFGPVDTAETLIIAGSALWAYGALRTRLAMVA